ncbi:hypothetical protein PPACK8108_LOCUS16848 [Phakopsora pachyrhizi]|uniref:Uncharacterized protein n=1 Tax=Phakopsora pachyrhizi TaxID=170000 RepID=A0AAV0B8F2_PHAPC|nr:hypothetical protein PPACK8108_LOCUS16848 [Phakopsora pachyrhizi]
MAVPRPRPQIEEPFSPPPSSSSTTRSDIIKNSPGSSKLIKLFLIHLLQHLQTDHWYKSLFKSTSKCGTVTEENSRGVDDPQTNSLVILTGSDLDFLEDDEPAELKKRSSILSSSLSSSSSNQKRPTRLGQLPRSNSSSTSFSIFGNNNINNDSTPRIRTRPSLTPSLMSDRSSSPFTEAEDDINKGFFDDIEFLPSLGSPTTFTQPQHPLTHPPHSPPQNFTDLLSLSTRRPLNPRELLNQRVKICARATMAERGSYSFPSDHYHLPRSSSTQSFVTAPSIPSSSSSTTIAAPSSGPRIQPPSSSSSSSSLSKLNQVSSQSHQFGNHPSSSNHFSSTIRRKFRAYEDRSDERVEDGLEIEINSINPDKLRSRTSSTLSSGSSLHPHSLNFPITRHGHLPRHQPQRSSLENPSHAGFISSHQQGALHQQNKLKRMTVPFLSSTTNSTVSKTGESAVDKSVATTSSTNSGRVKAAVSSNALSLAAPSPHSLKPPQLRTKSLKHTSSDPKIGDDHRPQSRLQHQASSSRVQSPSFGAQGGGTREQSVCLN